MRIAAGWARMLIGLLAIGGDVGIVVAIVGLLPLGAGAVNVCLFAPLFGADLWGHPRTAGATAH